MNCDLDHTLDWELGYKEIHIMRKTLKLAIAALSFAVLPALALAQVTATPAATVILFNPAAVDVAVGSAQQLTATFAVSGYTGSFTPTATLHYGHDYSAGAVNCTATAGGENCSVAITFQPTLPGGRKDALFLMDGSTRLATVLLYGVGQAPLALMQPGVVTSPVTSFANYIYDSTVDENGTVYFISALLSSIYSLPKDGTTPTLVAITGLSSPRSISIDGAGVLYISDQKYNASMTTYDTVQGVQGSIALPITSYWQFSNVDGIGDLFVNSSNNNSIYEIKADGTTTDTVINPTITQASNSAVDAAGDLFFGGYQINELTPAGVQTQINTVGAGEGMGVDAANTVYATRYTGVGGVAELPASDYTTYMASLDPAASPLGLGLASDGTLYVGNYGNLDKVDRTQGAIDFGSQTVGVASAVQNIGIYNGGNENLDLSSFVISGAGFATQAATTNSCPQGLAIAPGEFCQIGVTLTTPNAGSFSGTLTFTSNSLKASGTTHTVALSGYSYGVYMVPSPTALTFGNQNTGTTSTAQTVTLTNNGYYWPGTVGTPAVPSSTYSVTVPSACNSVAVGASCQVSVTFTPTAAQSYSGTVTLPISGSATPPSVTFTVSGTGVNPAPTATLSPALNFPSTNAGTTSSPLTATLFNTGASPLTGIVPSIAGTNPGDFALSTGTSACGSTLAVDSSCLIYVTFTPAGGAAYSATLSVADNAASSPQTIALAGTGVLGTQAITFALLTSPIAYSSGLTVPLVATGGASGNPVVFTIDTSSTGTGSITGSTLTVTGVGNFIIDANQAASTSYSAAPQAQRTVQVMQAAQSISFTQPTTPVTYSSGLTSALSATGGASGNSVVFTIDSSSTGAGTISGSTLTVTGVGSFVIDANQAGNTNYSAAPQVQRTVQVTLAAQTITFANPGAQTVGTPLTLSATASSGLTVAFTSTTTSACTVAGTQATFLTPGTCTIDANQAGNSTYAAATMVPQSFTVNAAPTPTYTVASPTAPQTVQPGGAATYTINVNPVNGSFTSAVTLTASGLPTGATASFSPATVTPGSEGASSTLTIQTAASTLVATGSGWKLATPVLALIGLFFVPGKRRRRWLALGVLLIASLSALTALSGCGGGFTLTKSSQSYTITVTGTSGADVQTTTVQLTVQ
jgi:hypothetical protein